MRPQISARTRVSYFYAEFQPSLRTANLAQLPAPKKRHSETSSSSGRALFNAPLESVNRISFSELLESSETFDTFRSTLQEDATKFSELIPRCEKPLKSLQMAKLACDFANQAHKDDWSYIKSCFVTGLKRKPEFETYYTQFKEFQHDLCE